MMTTVFNLNNQPVIKINSNTIEHISGRIMGYFDHKTIKDTNRKAVAKLSTGDILNVFTNERIASIMSNNILNINQQVIGRVIGTCEEEKTAAAAAFIMLQ